MPRRGPRFEFAEEFRHYCRENGVETAHKDYITYLNRVSDWLGQPIGPAILSREDQIEPLIQQVAGDAPSAGYLKNIPSVMRKYVSMVQSNYGGRFSSITPAPTPPTDDARVDELQLPERICQEIVRIVRDTEMARHVKHSCRYQCQLCDTHLERAPGVPYVEAHHLKPLGTHQGPDIEANLICVCPNHHVLLDYFAIPIERATLRETDHEIGEEFLNFHNEEVERLRRARR